MVYSLNDTTVSQLPHFWSQLFMRVLNLLMKSQHQCTFEAHVAISVIGSGVSAVTQCCVVPARGRGQVQKATVPSARQLLECAFGVGRQPLRW